MPAIFISSRFPGKPYYNPSPKELNLSGPLNITVIIVEKPLYNC